MKISDSLTPQTVTNLPKLKNEVRLAHSNAIYASHTRNQRRFMVASVILALVAISFLAGYVTAMRMSNDVLEQSKG